MDHLQNVRALEDLIEAYHGRDGTFNFHYSGFELLSWKVWLAEEMKKEDWDRMETEDYAVKILWTDNSNSYDSYVVLLNDIIAWNDARIDGYCACCGAPCFRNGKQDHDQSCVWYEEASHGH